MRLVVSLHLGLDRRLLLRWLLLRRLLLRWPLLHPQQASRFEFLQALDLATVLVADARDRRIGAKVLLELRRRMWLPQLEILQAGTCRIETSRRVCPRCCWS